MGITYHRPIPFRLASALLSMPDPLIQRFAGDPISVDGRTLNRSVQLLLKASESLDQDVLSTGDVTQRRTEMARAAGLGMPRAKGLHVVDRTIPGPESDLPLRVYRPFGLGAEPPAIVYFHGGGWVVGDIATHDGSCRALAVSSGCVVISVDYRLAPEHRFPAAPDDCLAAFRWVVDNAAELSIDPTAVAVAGDSAGGNLAAVVAQLCAGMDGPSPVAQGLIYPSTDFRMQTRSIDVFADGFFLTRESMHWFRDQYIDDDTPREDPMLSPLLADDVSGVAPAWVWTAGFDPLRDEGRAYAERLDKAGVTTHYRCYDDRVHGFFGMGVLPGGLEIIEEMGTQLGELIRSSARA